MYGTADPHRGLPDLAVFDGEGSRAGAEAVDSDKPHRVIVVRTWGAVRRLRHRFRHNVAPNIAVVTAGPLREALAADPSIAEFQPSTVEEFARAYVAGHARHPAVEATAQVQLIPGEIGVHGWDRGQQLSRERIVKLQHNFAHLSAYPDLQPAVVLAAADIEAFSKDPLWEKEDADHAVSPMCYDVVAGRVVFGVLASTPQPSPGLTIDLRPAKSLSEAAETASGKENRFCCVAPDKVDTMPLAMAAVQSWLAQAVPPGGASRRVVFEVADLATAERLRRELDALEEKGIDLTDRLKIQPVGSDVARLELALRDHRPVAPAGQRPGLFPRMWAAGWAKRASWAEAPPEPKSVIPAWAWLGRGVADAIRWEPADQTPAGAVANLHHDSCFEPGLYARGFRSRAERSALEERDKYWARAYPGRRALRDLKHLETLADGDRARYADVVRAADAQKLAATDDESDVTADDEALQQRMMRMIDGLYEPDWVRSYLNAYFVACQKNDASRFWRVQDALAKVLADPRFVVPPAHRWAAAHALGDTLMESVAEELHRLQRAGRRITGRLHSIVVPLDSVNPEATMAPSQGLRWAADPAVVVETGAIQQDEVLVHTKVYPPSPWMHTLGRAGWERRLRGGTRQLAIIGRPSGELSVLHAKLLDELVQGEIETGATVVPLVYDGATLGALKEKHPEITTCATTNQRWLDVARVAGPRNVTASIRQ